jgi:predicted aconitase with swiveling domain
MKTFTCHKISEGKAEGPAVVSTDDVMFYLIDPKTGTVIEKEHSLEGKSIAGKIMIFPSGKGSSVVQADGLFQLMKQHNQPKGMIVARPDTVLVTSAILFEIPMVDRVDPEFYKEVKENDTVEIDADAGLVKIL